MTDPIQQFKDAIQSAGLVAPMTIEADGKIHRFSSSGRPADDSGWYVFFDGDVPAGAYGCWRTGLNQTWCSKSEDRLTPAERDVHRQKVKAMQLERDADQARRQKESSERAAVRWQAAVPATSHPYLDRKGIQPHGIRIEGESLLIPMRDVAGTLRSLQIIEPDGIKRFLPGGRVMGCYYAIGSPSDVLIVCEGFATGASIHEATGHAVAVAFTANNLEAVSVALHRKYPDLRLIVAADDDWQTEGNPGMAKAGKAALAVEGRLAVPLFPSGRPDKATDFNDLYHVAGADAVRAGIEGAKSCTQAPEVGSEGEWPEPTTLPDGLPPVHPFDLELLPEALRSWVADIADRMQCPLDFPAVGAVVALSSLVGARVVVSPKARDDWRVVPNLWGLVVGRPGVMKSPALGEVLKPLHRLEAAEREQWQAAHESWELDCKVARLAADDNEKKAKGFAAKDPDKARKMLQPADIPAEPKARRYVVNDATVEKLGELLTDNPWGTLSYRDEIHGLLCSMDRQGQEGARAFYLQAYDGNQGYTVDRIGRGTHHIPRVCLAMLGGIQPGKVQSYVRAAVAGGAGDDGLLQRFGLAVWPDVSREFVYVDRWPDTPARQTAWAVFERLNELAPAPDADPLEWRFSADAQRLFEEWLGPFETEIRGDELHPALVSHLAKYRKLIPALALLFALVDTPSSGNRIEERELLRALAWADYLRTHAERLYAAAVMPETAGAQTLLNKLRAGRLSDGTGRRLESFAPRLVAVKHWAGLTTTDLVRKAADLLTDYGWLAREVIPSGASGGRPSERYLIHPLLLTGSGR